MRSVVLVLVFVAFVIGGLVALAPLSVLLRMSGVADEGVAWRQARGTAWKGQLSGLELEGNPAGNVELQLTLQSLLSGRGHDIVWSAPFGSARANVRVRPDGLHFDDLTATVQPSLIARLDPRIASLEGTITVRAAEGVLDRNACRSATGDVSTDLARQVALRFGRDWPLLTGPLSCVEGEVVADVSGEAADGTQISARIGGARALNVQVSNTSADVIAALQLAGFTTSAKGAELILAAPTKEIKP